MPEVKTLKRKQYKKLLRPMQLELDAAARWVQSTGQRLVVLFEGRDTAGKGGAIDAIREHLNPRQCRIVALPTPTERQKTEWYFQRYIAHLPAAGEIRLFDRSWYNRAGVEQVMGFATEDEVAAFLRRHHCSRSSWSMTGSCFSSTGCVATRPSRRSVSPSASMTRSSAGSSHRSTCRRASNTPDYTRAREDMLRATHTDHAPWTLVEFNDQKRGRLTLVRNLLDRLPDTRVPEKAVDFAPLKGKPLDEH